MVAAGVKCSAMMVVSTSAFPSAQPRSRRRRSNGPMFQAHDKEEGLPRHSPPNQAIEPEQLIASGNRRQPGLLNQLLLGEGNSADSELAFDEARHRTALTGIE